MVKIWLVVEQAIFRCVKMLKQIGFTEDEYKNFLQKHFIIF